MKSFFSICLLASLYVVYIEASPVSNHNTNQLNHPDQDSNEPVHSTEVMPGRFLTGQEIQNMIYLTKTNPKFGYKSRTKRFAMLAQKQRFLRNILQRRQERIRLRNERRRMRFQNQRLEPEANIKIMPVQNTDAKQRLHMLNLRAQQHVDSLNAELKHIELQRKKANINPVTNSTGSSKGINSVADISDSESRIIGYQLVPVTARPGKQ